MGWFVIAALFLLFIANKHLIHIFNLIENKEKKKIAQINEYISSNNSQDTKTRKAISDLKDAHYFKIATGIYAEHKARSALINLHETTSHHITWRHIRRAHEFIEISDKEEISIRPTSPAEKLGYWYNNLSGAFLLLLSATLFGLVFITTNKSVIAIITGLLTGFLCALISIFIFSQNWPIKAAKKISKELKK